MNSIEIKNLKKRYGTVQALDGLNMQVKKGSIYGFLGPNGAGKTTTLRILAGLAWANEGSVSLNGKMEQKQGNPNTHFGYLPEEAAFYSWMTPLEYLDFCGEIFHLDAQRRKTRSYELLERIGLKEAQKRRIGGFSHGMRQRLGLAQALVNEPEVLLLDEPVSALDPAGRKEILELIQSLSGSCTVLMSTHILADVERVCDTIGIINKGQMVIESDRGGLLDRYAVSALEVELANGDAVRIPELSQAFSRLEGVSAVSNTQNTLRLQVKDPQAASTKVMQQIMQNGVHITRLEVVRPSLEDIFFQLTGEGKVKQ
jgi:ABC-2 type transport system ATP-binding protein